jgi:hypothetical protein
MAKNEIHEEKVMETAKPLEEQYILRFAVDKLDDRIRQMVRSNELDGNISIHFPSKIQFSSLTFQIFLILLQVDLELVLFLSKVEGNLMKDTK